MENTYGESERTATITIGICVGITVSLVIMACFCVGSRMFGGVQKRPRVKKMHCQETAKTNSAQHNSLDTEGAYRSDSDADDEGQGQQITKRAQVRARQEGTV
jgi:hypothetical protein